MRRFRVTVEYDGRPFVGWQRQTNGATVQGALERAIAAATGETVATHAAGRTDAGVHARGQVAHFDLATALSPFRLMGALNAHLRPDPVAIITCEVVPGDFHARFDCLGRAYRYRIINRRAPLTVDLGFAWHVARPLDADTMHQAAQILVGEHDFTTFRSIHCQSLSPVKTLDRLNVRRDGEELIVEAAARSFLHHQVRSMVGCLKLVGDGQWTGERLKQALRAVDRTALGLNAPPDGLTFVEARYPHMSVELTKA